MHCRFSMIETMRGLHHFVDKSYGDVEDKKFYFKIDWGQELFKFINPFSPEFMLNEAEGVIYVEGLTDGEIACHGSLELSYLSEYKLRYNLNFEYNGDNYSYVGEKVDVKLWKPINLVKTHTICYGTLYDQHHQVISKSITHFELGDMVSFLTSLRLRLL